MLEVQERKKHAACDECRTRKLKCSGRHPKCSRCEREGIACVYSPQKQMGRPRKRRRDLEEAVRRQSSTPPRMPTFGDDGSEMMYISPGATTADFGIGFPVASHSPSPSFQFHDVSGTFDSKAAHNTAALDDSSSFLLDPQLGGFVPATPATTVGDSTINTLAPMHSEYAAPGPFCACLSSMYLTLSTLQSLTSLLFPFGMQPLRHALSTAESVLDCPQCPKDLNSAFLNPTIVTSLLFTIAQRFRMMVEEINEEAARMEQSGGTKRFYAGDANPETRCLHTGAPDCPGKFDLELDALEWRAFAKRIVKTEVYGNSENYWNSLMGIVSRLEARQMAWHSDPENETCREKLFGVETMQAHAKGDWQCIKQAASIRMVVENIPW